MIQKTQYSTRRLRLPGAILAAILMIACQSALEKAQQSAANACPNFGRLDASRVQSSRIPRSNELFVLTNDGQTKRVSVEMATQADRIQKPYELEKFFEEYHAICGGRPPFAASMEGKVNRYCDRSWTLLEKCSQLVASNPQLEASVHETATEMISMGFRPSYRGLSEKMISLCRYTFSGFTDLESSAYRCHNETRPFPEFLREICTRYDCSLI